MQLISTQMLATLSIMVHAQPNEQEIVKRTTNPRCFEMDSNLILTFKWAYQN